MEIGQSGQRPSPGISGYKCKTDTRAKKSSNGYSVLNAGTTEYIKLHVWQRVWQQASTVTCNIKYMDPKEYLEKFFALKQLPVSEARQALFEAFCGEERYVDAAARILGLQDMLMNAYKRKLDIDDIMRQSMQLPNGSVGKAYHASFVPEAPQWDAIADYELLLPGASGLTYDKASGVIEGTPRLAGDFRALLRFRLKGDAADIPPEEKPLSLIINPDPKSLWKDLPSDPEARFPKENEAAAMAAMGDRFIVTASKRGRSHANAGLFRDDHIAFRYFAGHNLGVIAISDGAGSAAFSREGSRIACNSVIDWTGTQLAAGAFQPLDALLADPAFPGRAAPEQELARLAGNYMTAAAQYALQQLETAATAESIALQDLHATLAFVLVKKYAGGYAFLSFGVGDCPIGLVYGNLSEVALLNTMDVGEYGGGTRFITQPEIFRSNDLASRVHVKILPDFDYLLLMSDGIYDPKFEVEANLTRPARWQAFIADLQGDNPDQAAVHFNTDNKEAGQELLRWMDFWSPGNHDDRSLAILF